MSGLLPALPTIRELIGLVNTSAFSVTDLESWSGLLPSAYRTPSTSNKSDNSLENE
jgi:hypothetical protein